MQTTFRVQTNYSFLKIKRRRGRVPELRVGDLVTVKYNKVAMDAYIIKYSKGKYDVRYIETKKIQRNFPKKYLFAKVL